MMSNKSFSYFPRRETGRGMVQNDDFMEITPCTGVWAGVWCDGDTPSCVAQRKISVELCVAQRKISVELCVAQRKISTELAENQL